MILNLKGDNMPPKNKFTRNEIISCALGIAEEGGLEAVTARAVASCLEASSKVIFGCFESMNELQNEVVAAAYQKYLDEQARLCESGESRFTKLPEWRIYVSQEAIPSFSKYFLCRSALRTNRASLRR